MEAMMSEAERKSLVDQWGRRWAIQWRAPVCGPPVRDDDPRPILQVGRVRWDDPILAKGLQAGRARRASPPLPGEATRADGRRLRLPGQPPAIFPTP
jgi:hypothetical protein